MGFEPTASSLGISASIAYKGHGVHGGDTDPWSFSNLGPLLPQQGLNGVETECKSTPSTTAPMADIIWCIAARGSVKYMPWPPSAHMFIKLVGSLVTRASSPPSTGTFQISWDLW